MDTHTFVPEYRRATFKSRRHFNSDDRRKKRSEELVEIRRKKRDELVHQARDIKVQKLKKSEKEEELSDGEEDEPYHTEANSNDAKSEFRLFGTSSQDLTAWLYSDETDSQLHAVQIIRDVLSESSPPNQRIIDMGIVPRIVALLGCEDDSVQYEASWVLTNIASGTGTQTKSVVDADGISGLVQLLRTSSCMEVTDQAAWALGNIAGESPVYRDMILDLGAMADILMAITYTSDHSTIQNMTWTLTNLCRGNGLANRWPLISPAVAVLRRLLDHESGGTYTLAGDVCWAAYNMALSVRGTAVHELVGAGIHTKIIKLMDVKSTRLRTAGLRCLGAFCMVHKRSIQPIIDGGLLDRLEAMLSDAMADAVIVDVCYVLSNIANGSSSQVQEILKRTFVVHLLRYLSQQGRSQFELKPVGLKLRLEACWVLRNILTNRLVTPEQSQLYIVDKGCIPLLCRQLDAGDNMITKLCLECLAAVLSNGHLKRSMTDGLNVSAIYMRQLGAVDKIERCTEHKNGEISSLAARLMDKYFTSDDSDSYSEPVRARRNDKIMNAF